MKTGIPQVYKTFRSVWTVLHVLIVAGAAALLLSWSVADNNAGRIFESGKDNLMSLQSRVASAVRWPWGG